MSAAIENLQRCLEQEADLVRRFITVLQQEAEALASADQADALTATTLQKTEYAQLLEQAAGERRARLLELGLEDGKRGLDAAARNWPALQSDCQALYELATQASQLNASNGAIIDMYLQRNQRSIDTLRRLAGIDHLYDASGRAQSMPVRNTHIKIG
jgi:flagella synthesis protein FlgN